MMTPEQKEAFWESSLQAAAVWDARFIKAVLTAIIMRHGKLVTCTNGCCTYPQETITLEELYNIVEGYNLGLKARADRTFELAAVPKEWGTSGDEHQVQG